MKLKYDAEKGSRCKGTHFIGVESWSKEYAWYSRRRKKWVNDPLFGKEELCSVAPCKSVRAFRRMLKKNPGIRGQATLFNRFVGCDVHG